MYFGLFRSAGSACDIEEPLCIVNDIVPVAAIVGGGAFLALYTTPAGL
jgi:hypothetical protein